MQGQCVRDPPALGPALQLQVGGPNPDPQGMDKAPGRQEASPGCWWATLLPDPGHGNPQRWPQTGTTRDACPLGCSLASESGGWQPACAEPPKGRPISPETLPAGLCRATH